MHEKTFDKYKGTVVTTVTAVVIVSLINECVLQPSMEIAVKYSAHISSYSCTEVTCVLF